MICSRCGHDETAYDMEEFVGIFANGITFTTTDGKMCGLFGCPRCHTVQFTTNAEYIQRRKEKYKNKMKNKN